MKKKTTTVLFILIFLAGLSLLLYPSVSNYWNSRHATQAVTCYREKANTISDDLYKRVLAAADEYNKALSQKELRYVLTDKESKEYEGLLNLDGNGMMGYVEIPAIDVELPIYHGTEESVLQSSVGHLDWTSLPVGGESTHSVLSGHRGLPRAKLFTDLDKLTRGDIFTVTVLNRTLTYEIDSIETVEPTQVDSLKIQEGEDLCTLVTCTPYGINTHRLLVRGHRIENAKELVHISSEAVQIEPLVVLPFLAVPMLLLAYCLTSLVDRRIKGDEETEENESYTQ